MTDKEATEVFAAANRLLSAALARLEARDLGESLPQFYAALGVIRRREVTPEAKRLLGIVEGWVKLERGNDCGREYLALPGKARDAKGMSDIKYGITFKEGDEVRVRWPNGEESVERIVNHAFSSQVRNRGRVEDVTYTMPGFDFAVRGVKQWIRLDAVEIWINDSTLALLKP